MGMGKCGFLGLAAVVFAAGCSSSSPAGAGQGDAGDAGTDAASQVGTADGSAPDAAPEDHNRLSCRLQQV